MANQPIVVPRQPPPPALTNMGTYNRASFISIMSEQAASAASASAASASSLASAQEAQSTADLDSYSSESSSSESQSQTVRTFGIAVPETSTRNPAATPTDSSGSSITSPATSSTQSSTFATSARNSAASEHASDYPDSSLQTTDKNYHSGPPSGKIAAAVAIPLIFLLALGFALFFLRRRRRRRAAALAGQPYHHHPMTDRSHFSKEAALAKPAPRTHNPSTLPAPILTSATNNTYYTGLSTPTTPSRTSTQTRGRSDDSTRLSAGEARSIYDIPPPAYARDAPPGSTPTLPQLSFAADPFMDPVSTISTADHTHASSPTGAALAALSGRGRDTAFTATSLSPVSNSHGAAARPNISRAGTMRSVASVTSDMYSDTASVRSARPERLSGATAFVVGNGGWNGGGVAGSRLSGGSFAPGVIGRDDPFGDPR